MREITLEELLEAGCHFGHQVTRQNPKARDYVFEARDNIHIIDLAKTKEGLDKAAEFIKNAALEGKSLLVVGTKKQAQGIVKEEVEKAMAALGENAFIFSVTNRWIGGTLTNFPEVSKNLKKLKDLEEFLANEEERFKYTKKEIGMMQKGKTKLEYFYGGIKKMQQVPDVIFIIDTHLEDLVVREAMAMKVPTIGITDTNADPTVIDHPIPANDDAIGSIKMITGYIIDAWIEGKKLAKNAKEETGAREKRENELVKEEKNEKVAKKVKKSEKSAKNTEIKKTTSKNLTKRAKSSK